MPNSKPQHMQYAEALEFTRKKLAVDNGDQEAQWMLLDILNISLAEFLSNKNTQLTFEQQNTLSTMIAERLSGKPLAYVLGHQDFYGLRFLVNSHVLIPRSETELIIDLALASGNFKNVADLGAGSGCIGLTLLKKRPQARLWACDISESALDVVQSNARRLGVDERLETECGAVESLPPRKNCDLVVSNPPYIAQYDPRLDLDVLNFEPHLALFAREGGLEYYKLWIPWTFQSLSQWGRAFFEVGQGQAKDVEEIFKANGFRDVQKHTDLFGVERVVSAQKG
jgi:release factor glutamine methyltransferase